MNTASTESARMFQLSPYEAGVFTQCVRCKTASLKFFLIPSMNEFVSVQEFDPFLDTLSRLLTPPRPLFQFCASL